MKELLITLITLAGLFIGVYYHDSLVGGGQEDQQQKTGIPVFPPFSAARRCWPRQRRLSPLMEPVFWLPPRNP